MNRVRILVLNAALGPLDYKLAEGMAVEAGSVVVAPLGPRTVTGVVWDEGRLPGDPVDASKLRALREAARMKIEAWRSFNSNLRSAERGFGSAA